MTRCLSTDIKGLLFDLDGTLYVGDNLIDGAVEALQQVKARNLPCRFLTNTTTRSLARLYEKTAKLGLPIEKDEIITPSRATGIYLEKQGDPSCYFLLSEGVKSDFAQFREDKEKPDFVIVGDIGNEWDYSIMNEVFNLLVEGSRLIALHKGKYRHVDDRLRMDIGGFVAALEFASDVKAIVMGKPSSTFYNMAVGDLGLGAGEVAMIGDDILGDIEGAQLAGLTGVLVKTGKYRQHLVERTGVRPDFEIDSVADLPSLLA